MKNIYLSGIIDGSEEENAVLEVIRSRWQTEGAQTTELQKELAQVMGVKFAVMTNSGSSANLLALTGLNLPKNSTVLSSACCFPATINPVLHLQHKLYLVDHDIKTLNIDVDQIEKALYNNSQINTLLIAHTLGNTADLDRVMYLKKKYKLNLIEDACESCGTTYNDKMVGSIGDIGTLSFFPSHQLNGFGGGGAVLTNDESVYNRIKSLKSWGKQNTREGEYFTKFTTKVDGINYDAGYTYQTIGYNMRIIDAQAAYLRQQLKRLPGFIKIRQRNYEHLLDLLKGLPLHFMECPPQLSPAYFGFPLVCKEENVRDRLVEHLEKNGIRVRVFFAGNILRHTPYKNIEYDSLNNEFPVADYLMRNALFCGCWPGLTLDDMEYIATTIKNFFEGQKS